MRIIYVNIICGDLRRYVWHNSSIFPTIPDFQSGGVKCRTRGCRNSANKVWYWPWFVRPWSIGRTRTQYSPRVLIFSNFFFLLTYLITQTRASENWHFSRTIWSILLMKLLKIASMRFAFRANLGTPAICMNRSPNIVICKRRLNRRSRVGGMWEPGLSVLYAT